MKLDNIADERVQKFLIESYNNEALCRERWNRKHRHLIKECAKLTHDAKNYTELDPIRARCEIGMAVLSRDHEESTCNKYVKPLPDIALVKGIEKDTMRTEHSIVKMGLGDPKDDKRLSKDDTVLNPDPVMRFMDPETRKVLYEFPPPRRHIYLRERSKLTPHDRYYFPQTSYMEYGWRPQDYATKPKPSQGRKDMMEKIYKERVGPVPDPPHYNNQAFNVYTKCISY